MFKFGLETNFFLLLAFFVCVCLFLFCFIYLFLELPKGAHLKRAKGFMIKEPNTRCFPVSLLIIFHNSWKTQTKQCISWKKTNKKISSTFSLHYSANIFYLWSPFFAHEMLITEPVGITVVQTNSRHIPWDNTIFILWRRTLFFWSENKHINFST